MSRSGGDPAAISTTPTTPRDTRDTLKVLDDLYRLTGSERIDLMVLNRAAPLARERALTNRRAIVPAQAGRLRQRADRSHHGAPRSRPVPSAPVDYRASFALTEEAGALEAGLVVRLQASVGLRNVLTHEYVDIDLDIVAGAVASAGQDYGQYVKQMASGIKRRSA